MKGIWSYIKFKLSALLSLKGDKHAIARGIAVGLAMNFIPTIGLGVPVVYWVAALVRGHRVAALIGTMSIKPLFPLLYILNYIVGELVLSQRLVYTLDWHVAAKAGAGFLLGSCINFVLSLFITYYLVLLVLNKNMRG